MDLKHLDEQLSKLFEVNEDKLTWYDFCKYVNTRLKDTEDIEEAIRDEADDLVYTADIINVWSDMPGNLGSGSRTSEITDLMLEDIIEGALEDEEFIRGLNESVKPSNKGKSINEMSYRSQGSGVALHKKVGTSNKDGVVNYRGTDVFTLKGNKVILNTGGWKTQTTKDRMNQALDEYGVGGEIKSIKGTWYYIKDGEKTPFDKDTLEITK